MRLSPERRVRARPRIETARSVVNRLGVVGEVERTVGLLDHARVGHPFLRLGLRLEVTSHEPRNRGTHQVARETGQALEQLSARLRRTDLHHLTQQHGAGVHADVHLHQAHTRLPIAAHDGPLNGSRTTPAREQRTMHVEAAQARCFEHVLRQDLSVGDHQREVQVELTQLVA